MRRFTESRLQTPRVHAGSRVAHLRQPLNGLGIPDAAVEHVGAARDLPPMASGLLVQILVLLQEGLHHGIDVHHELFGGQRGQRLRSVERR